MSTPWDHRDQRDERDERYERDERGQRAAKRRKFRGLDDRTLRAAKRAKAKAEAEAVAEAEVAAEEERPDLDTVKLVESDVRLAPIPWTQEELKLCWLMGLSRYNDLALATQSDCPHRVTALKIANALLCKKDRDPDVLSALLKAKELSKKTHGLFKAFDYLVNDVYTDDERRANWATEVYYKKFHYE